MPVVEIHLLEGYDADAKARLGAALTNAVRSVVPAAPDLVTVMIHDLPTSDYYRGGVTRQGAAALPDPADTVRAYLDAMEARDLDSAQAMLGDGFTMTFPGAPPMTKLQDLIDWARPRYHYVKKTYSGFDTVHGDTTVVYCHGTLQGEWPDGTMFGGVRFVDRFELTEGKITRQDVWNDLGEIRESTLG
jgi:phenylpyruvate tautomerase PptA (4-oxalocrotonate tautomerase family)